ncbi:uroporphyrinogen-III C-methyltransferase [Krasilnikoviella flava]|uniref:Uroporphyrin-III C-methyltransferase / precorrin-2 dehydrogenase / sirohydrochlorin ferrochelatase n=1 Tax=Krasilnikoviella flava TaxID=526729 RepID=A0A1T5JF96_9MICO|nr:uroporphyrinogen-III C-methyltransferase [Krasilnikoviella flava]SKC49912.1 uroporphyrin-III C-methyltransferase / precorrin-2 dehydrogenase / sirohydrochlorin ferrochelatase [Krasilnikoviella flava]
MSERWTPPAGSRAARAATPHDTYPLGLRVTGRLVIVVGGGPVALRRVRGLLAAGARVRVIAPDVVPELASLVSSGAIERVTRGYCDGDLDGAWLVHTATGDPAVDARVAGDAELLRTFCVTAGDAGLGSAWVPAVARTPVTDAAGRPAGDLTVAVTAGRDPRRAVRVRDAVVAGLDDGSLPLRPVRPAGSPDDAPGDGGAPRPGRVALVGGGPGAAGLITVRGRRLLAAAHVVVVDRLAPRSLVAGLGDDVEVVDVGKTAGNHPVPQEEISALLVRHALAGRDVVRLKGGDPYVFGRGGEELDACRAAGIEVEVVPGVTSAVSVPAAAGIPVTHRGLARGFSVLTGHDDVGQVPGGTDHTLVLLMGVTRLADTARALVTAGRPADTPVAVVEDGFGAHQRTTVGTLADIADRARAVGVQAPAVTVVGDVVRRSPAWVGLPGAAPAHTAAPPVVRSS